MFYRIEDGHGLPHNPFKALVAPRPIGWIATRGADGSENLAPYSYFNAVCDVPPIVMFSSAGEKDSLTFARQSGGFVAHSVSQAMFEAMNGSSASFPRGHSEIAAMGLRAEPARCVDAPRLLDAPSALECVVTQVLRPRTRDGAQGGSMLVFGEVVAVHIRDDLITDEGRFDSEKAALMARGGYMDYVVARELMSAARPKPPET